MSSTVRSVSCAVLLAGLVPIALSACGRSTCGQAEEPASSAADRPRSKPRSWEIPCGTFCGVTAKASSLDALCDKVSEVASTFLAAQAKCSARKPLGTIVDRTAAVKDVAVLDVTSGDPRPIRYALLALETQTGWLTTRELGSTQSGDIQLVASRPVDVVGLAPAAFELRVAIAQGPETTERLFVCGVTADSTVCCPLAVVVARRPAPARLVAGVAGAFGPRMEEPWLVDVDLTHDGFIATPVHGNAPPGLVGEHRWMFD